MEEYRGNSKYNLFQKRLYHALMQAGFVEFLLAYNINEKWWGFIFYKILSLFYDNKDYEPEDIAQEIMYTLLEKQRFIQEKSSKEKANYILKIIATNVKHNMQNTPVMKYIEPTDLRHTIQDKKPSVLHRLNLMQHKQRLYDLFIDYILPVNIKKAILIYDYPVFIYALLRPLLTIPLRSAKQFSKEDLFFDDLGDMRIRRFNYHEEKIQKITNALLELEKTKNRGKK